MPNKCPIPFCSIRRAFRPRHLSPFQGEPLYWMFPKVETLYLFSAIGTDRR